MVPAVINYGYRSDFPFTSVDDPHNTLMGIYF